MENTQETITSVEAASIARQRGFAKSTVYGILRQDKSIKKEQVDRHWLIDKDSFMKSLDSRTPNAKGRASRLIAIKPKLESFDGGILDRLDGNVMEILRVNAKENNTTIPALVSGIVNKYVKTKYEDHVKSFSLTL